VAQKESIAEADARIKAAIDAVYADAGDQFDVDAVNAKVRAISGWDAFNARVEANAAIIQANKAAIDRGRAILGDHHPKPFGGMALPPFPTDAPKKVEARPIREGAPPPPPRRKKAGRAIVSDVPEYSPGAKPYIEPGEGGEFLDDVLEEASEIGRAARTGRLKERLEKIAEATGIKRIMPRAKKPRDEHLTIRTISRPAGSGKSYQMMKWMAQQDELHHIIASPSLLLIREHEAALIEAGVPQERIKVITSNTGKKTVRVQLRDFFRKIPPTEPMVLLCTHAAMIMERPNETELIETKKGSGEWVESFVWAPEDWRLWWDEAPDVLVFGQQHCPYQHRIWTPFVHATRLRSGLMQLEPANSLPDGFDTERWEAVDFLKRIARNHPLEDAFTAISTLCSAIANENKLVLVREDAWLDLTAPGPRKKVMEGVLDTMIITHPANYGDFNEVVMLGARLENTMAMTLWQQMFGIKMEEHPIAKLIPATHKTKRLTVHYVFEERASRTFLEKTNEHGDTMFAEMAVAIAKDLVKHDEQALWNAPVAGDDRRYGVKNDFFAPLGKKYGVKRRSGKGMPFSKDTRLPGRTQGLNAYLDRHHVALLPRLSIQLKLSRRHAAQCPAERRRRDQDGAEGHSRRGDEPHLSTRPGFRRGFRERLPCPERRGQTGG
jgi:hypothetical protein